MIENITPEQKEKNKQYILDHFEEYVCDSRGNFVNAVDFEGTYGTDYYCIGKGGLTPEGYREIKAKFGVRHKQNGAEERERQFRENITSNSDNQQSPPNPVPEQSQNPISPSKNNNPQTQDQERVTNNYNNQTQNNPPNQDQPSDNPKENPNNPLPSSTDIQSSYNSDSTKSVIDNNPTLTTPEQKNQVNQLLKLIITAELLIKEKKFNPQTLSQLIKEKEQSTPSYQALNKEGRMDQVIQQLQNIQKAQKNNNPVVK
ncbi:2389_t:CDS:2, partial [Ambispora leptoticha]